MLSALKNAMLSTKTEPQKDVVRTLADSFHYPKRGPGMMWEGVANKIQETGCDLRMGFSVERICWESGRITAVEVASKEQGERISLLWRWDIHTNTH